MIQKVYEGRDVTVLRDEESGREATVYRSGDGSEWKTQCYDGTATFSTLDRQRAEQAAEEFLKQ